MEDQQKELNIEKVNLEKDELPPDSKITIEKRELHQNKQISQENEENKEVIENNDEANAEEINEEEENGNEEEAYNEEEGENQEIQDDDMENQEIPDDENNNEEAIEEKEEDENKMDMDSMEAENEGQNDEEQNEEGEENQEEEDENNEEEELQQNEQEEKEEKEEKEEQHEYKERQAIHIHKEEQEKEENNEEENDNVEESGKIHPIHPVENNENNIKQENQEEKIEYINREEEENEVEQNQVKKEEEIQTKIDNILYPKDSKPKLDTQEIHTTKKITQTKIIKKVDRREEIPRILVFQKKNISQVREQEQEQEQVQEQEEIQVQDHVQEKVEKEKVQEKVEEEKEVIKPNVNIETKKYEGFVEIPKSERHKYKNAETIVIQKNGIESGVYEFTGESKDLKIAQPGFVKAEITQEEIINEINRRSKKQKQKKTSYEVIDKFYTLTLYKERYNTVNTVKNTDINKANIEKEEYNVEININTELSKSSLPEDNYSKYILEQVNKLRTDPQSFIGIIEDAKANIKQTRHGRYYYNCNNIKVGLKQGEAAFNEAIEFLKTCQPVNPLSFTKALIPPMPKNEEELIDRNYLRINVEKLINSGIRINSYWRDVIKDPEVCFLLMIVDDNGQKKGMKRKDIMNPNVKYVGISSAEINDNFVNYFVLSS